ncbi:MAG: hypothetical protein ABR599_04360 [Gemmatimonadota bacterium]
MRSPLFTEKATTACLMTALNLAWFLALDILGARPELSLLGWAGAAPILLYPLLGRVAGVAQRRTESSVCPQRTLGVLNFLRGQIDPSVRTILDCCGRLGARAREENGDWRTGQEAATIHAETVRLHEALARAVQGTAQSLGAPVAHVGEPDPPAPRQDRRAVTGYVRRASSLAKLHGLG